MTKASGLDPTRRFSNRVDDYVKARPSYAEAAIDFILEVTGITAGMAVADIGSGTGIFTQQLLNRDLKVYGVEPNQDMRAAAEEYLEKYTLFTSIAGQGEETHLPDRSVNLITVAQALHWLDHDKARKEFQRILKKNGWVCAVWNTHVEDANPFVKSYLQFSKPYATAIHTLRKNNDHLLFFKNDTINKKFKHTVNLDQDMVLSRFFSSSYAPSPNEGKTYDQAKEELERIFRAHQKEGIVEMAYETEVYIGRV